MPLGKVRQGLTHSGKWCKTLTMEQSITGVFEAASDLQAVRVGLARPARHGGFAQVHQIVGKGRSSPVS